MSDISVDARIVGLAFCGVNLKSIVAFLAGLEEKLIGLESTPKSGNAIG
jgi:hypothetical protein